MELSHGIGGIHARGFTHFCFDRMGYTLDGIEDRYMCDVWRNEGQALVDARRQLVIIHRQMATLTNLFRHLDHSRWRLDDRSGLWFPPGPHEASLPRPSPRSRRATRSSTALTSFGSSSS